jgi:hypothetical protein
MAGTAMASPAVLVVDQANSNVSVTLCLTVGSTQCDTDISPVAGSLTMGLDCLTNPAALTLHDFNLQLTNTLNLNLNYGPFVGRFDAVVSNTALHYATPGTPQPPTPLTLGAFTYPNVPETATGTMAYTSTNLVCVALQAAMLPCADSIDLSTLGVNTITFDGTANVAARNVAVVINVNSVAPLDPNNPGLGTLTIIGTVRASGVVPVPSVDDFCGVLVGAITQPDLVCESDINFDGAVNGLDVRAYMQALGL